MKAIRMIVSYKLRVFYKNLVILPICWVSFFFFKLKTAYEISECDWSSDVCSSDLAGAVRRSATGLEPGCHASSAPTRSEERRVGKECRRGCRSRWARDHEKRKE